MTYHYLDNTADGWGNDWPMQNTPRKEEPMSQPNFPTYAAVPANVRVRWIEDYTGPGGLRALSSLRRASDLAHPWTLTPTEAGALVAEFERIKKAFNAADTLCVEIGYALEGKEVPKDKDELLDRVVELRDARRLDNAEAARAYDMGRDMERAAVVTYLLAGTAHCVACMDEAVVRLADAIERGEHRREEEP